jgi:hypothetical protein
MNDEKWIDEIDAAAADAENPKPPRNLTDIEAKRLNYLTKLGQQQAAKVDLLIAEAYLKYDMAPGTLQDKHLSDDEAEEVKRAKNNLALTNAQIKMLVVKYRDDCNVPSHAKIAGNTWYTDVEGKPAPVVDNAT